ncbi:hypothetical protein C0992_010283 [Termitomyces sp. T32_za158]|nr:hypothetical protein C0992_010283 [Termitomyces sp. T32_za158]
MAEPPSPPTESKILTLQGQFANENRYIVSRIDWRKKVIDLKESVKEQYQNKLERFGAHQLILYKLGNEGVDCEGMKHLFPYGLATYLKNISCSRLKDCDPIHECWPLDENGVPSNKNELHFLVVVPGTRGEEEVFMNELAIELREWCESTQASPTEEVDSETLRSLGKKFPLQQCGSIVRRLRAHMLKSFKTKYTRDSNWLRSFLIPVIGAASGTGKTAICSRLLDEMASEYNSSPTSATLIETLDDHGLTDTTQNNMSAIRMVVADSERHLPKPAELESLPLPYVWTESRLASFRQKVITSANRKLTLTVDLKNSAFNFAIPTLETHLAAALLDAYSKRFAPERIWQTPSRLVDKFVRHRDPLYIALRVLRTLEDDNIIVIHLDETQHVPSETLQTLVRLLVKKMHADFREEVPWIFPILSGLSLESLLDLRQTNGAQVEHYTPPVLSISSMLNIVQAMFYANDENDVSNGQVKQPDFQKGFIRLLHDLRGPTRYLQAVLLYVQNSSGMVNTQQWDLGAIINREAIRAGLEKLDQNWDNIFDLLARLICSREFMKNIDTLGKDPKLLQRLFDMHLSGTSVWVQEALAIEGEERLTSTPLDRGWATIMDMTKMNYCTTFLPFLTLYGAATYDPYSKYHPSLTPLCKALDWTVVEKEDARMLQYRLTQRSKSKLFDTRLSDLFDEPGDVLDEQFCLTEAFCDLRTLEDKVQSYDALSALWSTQSKPTIYVNGALAEFASSFVFLRQPNSPLPYVLCMQSKFLQKNELTMTKLHQEHKQVADVCHNFPFTLVIPADRVAAECWTSLEKDAVLKSHVLILNPAGFDAFYGKQLAFRRKIFSGLLDLPEVQA